MTIDLVKIGAILAFIGLFAIVSAIIPWKYATIVSVIGSVLLLIGIGLIMGTAFKNNRDSHRFPPKG